MKSKPLISAFDDLLGPPVENEIPEGFFSTIEIARHQKLSEVTIAARLERFARQGKIERRKFRNESGRVCWFYRVK